MTKPIYIHAGAHRTGSSSFQLCLAQNRDALKAAGFDLAYPGRDGIPDAQLKLRMPRGNVGAHRLPEFARGMRRHLNRLSPDETRSLILSEENIPGPMRHFYEGGFFPFAANRLQALAKALPARPTNLLYVLRSYDQLFCSAYRKRAEENIVIPFEDLVSKFLSFTNGWPWLIGQIQENLQPERLTVMTHAAGRNSLDLLEVLTPDVSDLPLNAPTRTVNRSATDAALVALQKRFRNGESLKRNEIQSIIAEFAENKEHCGFAEFQAPARQQLRDRYAADIEAVARIPNITFSS
jgi:hypothetical protein